ncbi:MAG: hypothetical protein BWY22_01472 [Bacteroidetes bacterium ADurb.Bin217]|nr:MAG: hypothetical protein BWY22_01472 [Bacteroidetes bacterium ADurb.Bin217]
MKNKIRWLFFIYFIKEISIIKLLIIIIIIIIIMLSKAGGYDHWAGMPEIFE